MRAYLIDIPYARADDKAFKKRMTDVTVCRGMTFVTGTFGERGENNVMFNAALEPYSPSIMKVSIPEMYDIDNDVALLSVLKGALAKTETVGV